MSDTVTRDDAGGVATLTLQRPGCPRHCAATCWRAVAEVAADDSVRAVLLTGTGRAFCVGQDLAEHVESLRGNAATSLRSVEEEYNPLILTLAALRVPVVVAINGACAGAGLGIALAGDLRIAAAGAKLTTAFTGIGLSSDSALAARLVHCVGVSRATQLLLLPEPFLAETAAAVGAGAPRRPAGAGACRGAGARGPARCRTDRRLPRGEDGAGHGGHGLAGGDARAGGAAADASWGRPPTTGRPWRPSSPSARRSSPADNGSLLPTGLVGRNGALHGAGEWWGAGGPSPVVGARSPTRRQGV